MQDLKEAEGKLKELHSQPTNAEAEIEILELEKRVNAMEARLHKLSTEQNVISKEEKENISKSHELAVKEWRKRKRMCTNVMDAILESYPKSKKDFIEAKDFVDETLITYPVEPKRLDIFSQILIPAKVEPKVVRHVELTSIILLLVASNRGVSVLPDWVLNDRNLSHDLVKLRLNATGVTRKLYAATRDFDLEKSGFLLLPQSNLKIIP